MRRSASGELISKNIFDAPKEDISVDTILESNRPFIKADGLEDTAEAAAERDPLLRAVQVFAGIGGVVLLLLGALVAALDHGG